MLVNREEGQGLVEYALIIALIAIVLIVALNALAPIIGSTFSKVGASMT
jgi:pilus assembly protein Flp/PilA